ncbi:MAG: hypothetical protein ABR956_07280 [Terracidiphilus sp.]|jgi:uncharacterized Tic20 family protein
MKDIVISARQIIRELLIFAGCFLAALVVNVYSIVHFNTEWKELITTLHITLALALVFFGLVAVIRGIVFCCRRALRQKA